MASEKLGYEGSGGNSTSFLGVLVSQNYAVQAALNGKITQICHRFKNNGSVKVAVYSADTGGTRLTKSYIITGTAGNWACVDCSADNVAVVAGTKYYPRICDGGGGYCYTIESNSNKYAFGTYANEMANPGSVVGSVWGYKLHNYIVNEEVASGPAALKVVSGVAKASVKKISGTVITSIKKVAGVG